MSDAGRADTVSTALTALAFSLKIAREATDDVPIVKQILGSALHIVELVLTIRNGNADVKKLGKRSAALATQIHQVCTADGRVLDGILLQCLQRLEAQFLAIETFVEEVNAHQWREMFRVADRAREFVTDLNQEIQDFLMAATMEANLRVTESSQYDGEFRRLRHCDIQRRLGVLRRTVHHDDDGNVTELVTFEKVRVDNEVMVLRSATSSNLRILPRTTAWSVPYNEDLLRRMVLTSAPSPYLSLFYGSSTRASPARFSVIRGGTRDLLEFVRGLDEAVKPKVCLEAALKIINAVQHLNMHGASWHAISARDTSGAVIAFDECGEPMVGAFDDIVPLMPNEVEWFGVWWRLYFLLYLAFETDVVAEETALDDCFEGIVHSWMEEVDRSQPEIWKLDAVCDVIRQEGSNTFMRARYTFPTDSAHLALSPSLEFDFEGVVVNHPSWGLAVYHTLSLLMKKPSSPRLKVNLQPAPGGDVYLTWSCSYYSGGCHIWDNITVILSQHVLERIMSVLGLSEMRPYVLTDGLCPRWIPPPTGM